jgi:PAS domain S-box-containing protein
VDLDGLLLEVNPSFARMFFSTAEESEGASFIELLDRSEQAPVLRELGALSRGEANTAMAVRRFQAPDGAAFEARTFLALIRDREGDPDQLLVMVEGRG